MNYLDTALQDKSFEDLDVLHLVYYFDRRTSIRKIIENVITNSPSLRQNVLPFSRTSGKFNELEVIRTVNQLRPKILHLHFSSLFDKELFKILEYRPIIVATIHDQVESPYREFVDVFICIHEAAYSLNKGRRIIIENTPFVTRQSRSKNFVDPLTLCFCSRFHEYCITEETLRLYAQLHGDVFIYGFLKGNKASGAIVSEASKHENLRVRPWSDTIEEQLHHHDIFAYFPPTPNSHLCYGLNVMEAVALGMPVVAVRRQSRRPYLVDGFNGFAVSTGEEFVSKCNALLDDRSLFMQILENASQHAMTVHNSMPVEYETLYRSLLEGSFV